MLSVVSWESLGWMSIGWVLLGWMSLYWVSLCWVSLCWVSLCWVLQLLKCHAECRYTEYRYAERRGAPLKRLTVVIMRRSDGRNLNAASLPPSVVKFNVPLRQPVSVYLGRDWNCRLFSLQSWKKGESIFSDTATILIMTILIMTLLIMTLLIKTILIILSIGEIAYKWPKL